MFKIEGLDKLHKELNQIAAKAKEIEGENLIPLSVLLNDEFIASHTNYLTVDELIEHSGFTVESQEDFERIPEDEWNSYIRKATRFTSWDEMLEEATREYVVSQLAQLSA